MRTHDMALVGMAVATVFACSPTSTENGSPTGSSARDSGSPGDGHVGPVGTTPALSEWTAADPEWTETSWSAGNSFFNLYASESWVFARTWDSYNGGRVFLSTDAGVTWNQISSADSDIDILSVAMVDGNILAGTWNGFYLSTSGGTSWDAVTPSGLPADTAIRSLAAIGSTLFAGTTGHIFRSSDNGSTWTAEISGIPSDATVIAFAASGSAILAGTTGRGVFATTNGGASWAAANSGLADAHITQLATMGNRAFAVTLSGVYVSTNNGGSWAPDSSGLASVNCYLAGSNQLLAGTDNSGVQLSLDNGMTWTSFNAGLPDGARIWSMAAGSDSVFAGTDSGIWSTPLLANSAPTVVTAASASPNPVSGTTASLSVLGADDAGEASLTYTWATSGTPPADVVFGANGSNEAKNTTVTFSKAGTYTLRVTLEDQQGLTAASTVSVTVEQTLTSVILTPANASVAPLGSQTFVATGRDQFASTLATQPTFVWTVNGGGTIDADGQFVAGATVGGPYVVTAQSGGISGTATISVSVPNVGPTIITPAAASPNPVSATTTSLSVLADDDAGESNLTYTWATSGSPPALVSFSTNGSNGAKSTTATFTKAGEYALQVTVRDQLGLTTSSSVTVTVSQTLSSIAVLPASATINTSATQQFTANARDQFGASLAAQPLFTWAVNGGGAISSNGLFTAINAGGPYIVTASSNGVSGLANVTVTATPTTVYQINCGSNNAVTPFTGDRYGSGGTLRPVTSSINTTGITDPAPMAVYQSERYGNSTYTLPNLTAGSQYLVRLHFAELYWTATGRRRFNVVINGATVLSNFDIYATVGARYRALVREFPTTASVSGQIVINFQTVTDNATIEGIEIVALTPNYPPSIVTAPSASPNPVSGTTASLSVLGMDDEGETGLTYTWSTLATSPAAVAFGANGTNAAKSTTATFSKAGEYTLQVTVRDQPGLTTTATVVVSVAQTLTSIVVAPASTSLDPLATQQFTATARDQFATALAAQPVFFWSANGGGTIDANGLFTAQTTAGGPYTVTAQSGTVSGTATVAVAIPNAGPTITSPAAATPNPVAGTTTTLSVLGDDDAGEANLTYTWTAIGTPPAPVAFSGNGTNAAKSTTATFSKAGEYTFQVTVKDQPGLTASSLVTVTVNQTSSSIVVSPASATITPSAAQQFTAIARDQFGAALAVPPTCTWTVSGGGSISAGGLFIAGSSAGGPFTVTATGGGISGTASVTVSATPSTVYQISAGSNSAAAPFTADQYASGGSMRSVTNTITLSGITDPAPMAVYQSYRYGNSTYTLPSLTPGGAYTVRLHFAELYYSASGQRTFNVVINGTPVLQNFDVYAAAGGRYRALLREFTATANGSGQIIIDLQTVSANAIIGGIEIITSTPNNPPGIAVAASASPDSVSGTTALLSVLGDDDAGEANLTYTWSTTGTPPAAVTFSANGTNAAKSTTATFASAGSYTLQVTVRDQPGLTAGSSVTVTVDQTFGSILVSPASSTVNTSATQQFTASARDQFGNALATQPSFAWSVSGGGNIGPSGLFTAGASAGGPFTVTATSGGVSGTASVTVSAVPATVYQINTGSNNAASPFTADRYGSGGTKRTVTSNINMSGISDPAPMAVYQSELYGNSTYTLPDLTAGGQYRVRLHFAELYWTGTGRRRFNVVINGTTVLSSFDIYAETGARYRATVKEFITTANALGQIVINFQTVTDNATIEGIEVLRP